MGSSSREEIVEVFNALKADLDRLCELSFDVSSPRNYCGPWSAWNARHLGCGPLSTR